MKNNEKPKLTQISKIISHALRHEPHLYELELDQQGWVNINHLLNAIKNEVGSSHLDAEIINEIIQNSEKPRFEIKDDMIRAIYGHSIKQTIFYQPSLPPEILYHGTVEPFVTSIINQNLKPMSRQYVHLSPDINMAKKVAARKGTDIVILQIQAFNAYNNGVEFYKASDYVWLSKEIPSKYITR